MTVSVRAEEGGLDSTWSCGQRWSRRSDLWWEDVFREEKQQVAGGECWKLCGLSGWELKADTGSGQRSASKDTLVGGRCTWTQETISCRPGCDDVSEGIIPATVFIIVQTVIAGFVNMILSRSRAERLFLI